MKKFRFRLQPLLQLKEHVEKEKQKNLAAISQKVIKQESTINGIIDDRLNKQAYQRKYMTGKLNKNFIASFSRYYVKLKKDELTGIEFLRLLRKDESSKRDELIQASKEKKSFEKLKENLKTKHNKDLDLSIQKEQDEIATRSFIHKKRLPRDTEAIS